MVIYKSYTQAFFYIRGLQMNSQVFFIGAEYRGVKYQNTSGCIFRIVNSYVIDLKYVLVKWQECMVTEK